jgi:hypothetical protein
MASPRKFEPYLAPLMNNTKWNELRVAMDQLKPRAQWRTKDVENGYISQWDGDWFDHLRLGGYETIEWLEIKITSAEQNASVLNVLQSIHVPGVKIAGGYRIYGYLPPGTPVDYIE